MSEVTDDEMKQFYLYDDKGKLQAICWGLSKEDAIRRYREGQEAQRLLKIRHAWEQAQFHARQHEYETKNPVPLTASPHD